jgi:hypothetical protein
LARQAVRCDWLPDDDHKNRAAIVRIIRSYLSRHPENSFQCRVFVGVARLLIECDRANLREEAKILRDPTRLRELTLAFQASNEWDVFMAKNRARFSDEIRAAVERSGLSRYAICKALSIPPSSMPRFMSGKNWLGQDTLDALAELLDLHIAAGKRPKKKG